MAFSNERRGLKSALPYSEALSRLDKVPEVPSAILIHHTGGINDTEMRANGREGRRG